MKLYQKVSIGRDKYGGILSVKHGRELAAGKRFVSSIKFKKGEQAT